MNICILNLRLGKLGGLWEISLQLLKDNERISIDDD